MSYGHLLITEKISIGYGWRSIEKPEKLLVVILAIADSESAKKLWASLPPVYHQCAVAYTDFWDAYHTVIPNLRHRPVYKDNGETNHIERFNNTLRQRISRLVRETLSFSKKVRNAPPLSTLN